MKITHTQKFSWFISFTIICLLASAVGCLRSSSEKTAPITETPSANLTVIKEPVQKPFRWFQLTETSLTDISSISKAVSVPLKPWTEAVRISSSLQHSGTGFLLVNKAGILTARGLPSAELITDASFFPASTSGSLMLFNGNILFHTYRNSYFSEVPLSRTSSFIVRYEDNLKLFFPLFTKKDITLDEHTEINDVFFDGSQWFFSAKTSLSDKTGFSYIRLSADPSLLNLSVQQKRNRLDIEQITAGRFRNASAQKNFSTAPGRLQRLLERIPEEISFTASVRHYTNTDNVPSAAVYNRGEIDSDSSDKYECSAVIEDNFCAALFSDGTFLFSGSLSGRTTVKNGSSAAFRLPKLPSSFIYTYFSVSGSYLYAAWEESVFYQTGKAGLLIVDLSALLY